MAKREPLRIPQAWKDQARAFVIQLERILDDVYNRLVGDRIPLSDKDNRTIADVVRNEVFPIERGTRITSAVNFNDLLDVGIYSFPLTNTVVSSTNKPCDYAGKLVVYDGTGENKDMSETWAYRIQEFHDIYGRIYIRTVATSSSTTKVWSSWVQLANTNIRGRIESGTTNNTDLDNCIYAGTYLYNPNSLHIPYASYGLCVVVATNDPTSTGVGWVNQIAISTSKTSPDIYVRKRINSGTSWSSWIRLADVNSLAVRATNARNSATVTLYRSTGTISNNAVYYHLEGNVLMFEGRLTVSNYARTNANGGFTITLPSGKKNARAFSCCCGMSMSTNEGFRGNEYLYIVGEKDGTVVDVRTSETHTNLTGGTNAWFTIFPVPIEVY